MSHSTYFGKRWKDLSTTWCRRTKSTQEKESAYSAELMMVMLRQNFVMILKFQDVFRQQYYEALDLIISAVNVSLINEFDHS